MMRTIIIDDEPLALRQMRSYVERFEEMELVGEFGSAVDAEHYLEERGVDLIFCDINMPVLSGVEFVRRIQERDDGGVTLPMVIFTTAHAEYAIEGFRLDAVDYLLKPLSLVDFARSVTRAYSLFTLRAGVKGASETEHIGDEVVETDLKEQYITVKADYRQVPLRVRDIVYLESEGEYIRLHLESGRSITTFYRLKNMEIELPSEQFIRIHRSYIINVEAIKSYERGRVYISQIDYLPIGQNYREGFLRFMANR